MFSELLERRCLLSAVPSVAVDANGVLQVVGTDTADTITVKLVAVPNSSQTNVKVTIDTPANLSPHFSTQVDEAGVHKIRVIALGGDDSITMDTGGGEFTGIAVAIFGNTGNDSITGANGNELLVGGEGNDSIVGGNGNNVIAGNGGDDTITAGGSHNLIFGGFGNDHITVSGSGISLIDGGPNDDLIGVGDGNSLIFGGAGNDTVTTGAGHDTVLGGFGSDNITTTSTAAVIFAGPGDDTVNGQVGDTIWGGGGNDVLTPSPAAGNHVHAGISPNDVLYETIWRSFFVF